MAVLRCTCSREAVASRAIASRAIRSRPRLLARASRLLAHATQPVPARPASDRKARASPGARHLALACPPSERTQPRSSGGPRHPARACPPSERSERPRVHPARACPPSERSERPRVLGARCASGRAAGPSGQPARRAAGTLPRSLRSVGERGAGRRAGGPDVARRTSPPRRQRVAADGIPPSHSRRRRYNRRSCSASTSRRIP
jgi:hypothetical protein